MKLNTEASGSPFRLRGARPEDLEIGATTVAKTKKSARSQSGLRPGSAAWLEARPSVVANADKWIVVGLDGLQGLTRNEVKEVAVIMGFPATDLKGLDHGALIGVLAGWPWTPTMRQEDLPAPVEVEPERVAWWLADLLEAVGCDDEEEFLGFVENQTRGYPTVVWVYEEDVRVDVFSHDAASRLVFTYPFSVDTFESALANPFDETSASWLPPSELRQRALDAGYGYSPEELDGWTISELVDLLTRRVLDPKRRRARG